MGLAFCLAYRRALLEGSLITHTQVVAFQGQALDIVSSSLSRAKLVLVCSVTSVG